MPETQRVLNEWLTTNRMPTEGLRSKDWNEFARDAAPPLNRMRIFVSLPLDKLDRLSIQNKLRDIGKARA